MKNPQLHSEAIALLKALIETPSLSKEEGGTALLIENFFNEHNIKYKRSKHNIWAKNKYFKTALPTILLNSHHDTVKPNKGYTKDPFKAIEEEGKLYGLGSNDAGGCLVSLIATFLHFYEKENLNYNLIIAATAEEEISGKNGIEYLLPQLGKIDLVIIGEPTLMDIAIAEKGLMVLDCVTKGKAGHAARDEGINALYMALDDINWVRNFEFPKVSESLGPIKMSATIIKGGSQHNVVPDTCTFTIDVRTTDAYTNEETLSIIQEHLNADVVPRSTRLNPSGISLDHPFVKAAIFSNSKPYGSPTLSDQALIPFPSVKMGPGNSARSHTPDEFIYLNEIEEGIDLYIDIIGILIEN